jgi:beta-barrel assembly-enhancing protease
MNPFEPNHQNQGRPSIKGRLIVACVIILMGLISYWSKVEENPITHQKQHVSLTPGEEIKLGLESAPMMSRKMGGEVPETDPRTKEVSKIGNDILSKTVNEKSPWKFKFHLLADPKTVNAFALPGGQIFITLGLLNKLTTEAQLAGVLSHEIGHVIERHSAQQMAKSQLGDVFVAAVATAATNPDGQSQFNPAVIAAVVNHMVQLRYSRHDESEADLWGIKLMSEAGFDPRAMLEVLAILKAESAGGHSLEIFQTHPNPDLRIEQIKAFLEKNPPKAGLREGQTLSNGLPR